MDTVNLTIDGIPIKAPKGEKVLWAALDNGIYIPNLCAIRRAKEPHAGCRLCFVGIEGRPGPVTACTEPVAEGMVVHTTTPEVKRLRRTAAELLIATECPDCRTCAKNRHCELQRVAAHVGVKLKPQRLRKSHKSLAIDSSNPFFILDPNKCILCGKCVWVCSEIVGADAINFTSRGFDATPMFDESCEACGECVAICPVGALVEKNLRWPKQEVKTICPYCAVGCGIYLGLDNGVIVSVRGDEENPVNRGSLCARGRFGIAEFVHHQDRLTTPLVKKGRGFVEISWEEAIELVARRLAQYKGEKFGLISSVKSTNEDNYILQKFARVVMGSNNIDSSARLRDGPTLVALGESFGAGAMSNPMDDIESAACIFVIGTNPTSSHPILGQRIRRAARNGAKLIIANPREIDLCRHASLWLRNRPGSDLALLMGMMRIIIDEGLADLSFIEARCENFDALTESLSRFDLKLAEELSGVPQQLITDAARTYAGLKPATILFGSGLTQHIHGTENVYALANLAMLTGNIGQASSGIYPIKGENNAQGACDMGALPGLLPDYQPLSGPDIREKFEAAWGCPLSPNPGLTLGEMLDTANEGRIQALYIVGADPALDMANIQQVRQALKRLEFLVVQDIFLTQTARLADLVLPAASFAEKDGTFTNIERRVQLVRQAIEPIGDSRPDWQIACRIAQKMGATGFDFEHPSQIMDEVASLLPSYGGISHQRLEDGGIQYPCPSKNRPGTPRLHTKTFIRGKGRFTPLVYRPPAEEPDDEYPLMLTIERSLYHQGNMSRKVKGLNTLRPEELVEINPLDAANLGVADGESVRVISRRGVVKVKAKITEASPPGVVCMSSNFAERPANLLTNSTLDASSKTPELKVSAIRIAKT
jgi:formate dehydrogenase alpha subunit